MNYEKFKWVVLIMLLIWLAAVVSMAESANALQPEADIPGYCEKYNWPLEREREVCELAEDVPCLTLWGMWLMADNESKKVKAIIAKKYVTRGCLYGAY